VLSLPTQLYAWCFAFTVSGKRIRRCGIVSSMRAYARRSFTRTCVRVQRANSVDTLSFKRQIYLDAIARANAESRECPRPQIVFICQTIAAVNGAKFYEHPRSHRDFRNRISRKVTSTHSRDVHRQGFLSQMSSQTLEGDSRMSYAGRAGWGCMQRRYPDRTLSTRARKTKSSSTPIRKNPDPIDHQPRL